MSTVNIYKRPFDEEYPVYEWACPTCESSNETSQGHIEVTCYDCMTTYKAKYVE